MSPDQKRDSSIKHDHLPPPSGPFVNMQVNVRDFVHVPSCQDFKYMLVITNMCSKWTEAFPTRKEDASCEVLRFQWQLLWPQLVGCVQLPGSDRAESVQYMDTHQTKQREKQ